MFDRFSDEAKKLLSFSRQEAIRLHHDFIAPEHLLLGLLQLQESVAIHLLAVCGIHREALRQQLARLVPAGTAQVDGIDQLPFTPAAKRVLELTLEEAGRASARSIESTHLLLGLVGEGGSPAAKALAAGGADMGTLRTILEAAQPRFLAPSEHLNRSRLRLLLISNSTMHRGSYLEHCAEEIRDFLGTRKRVLFVPYALRDHDAYANRANQAFAAMGHDLVSAHSHPDPLAAIEDVDALFVGGGNTFRLLDALYHHGLLPVIQQLALAGMPYIGSSAGTNVATLSIRTTNDMPIVQPPSFAALQLVPFQINPHYLDPDPGSTHMGETREERLRQFLEEHEIPVLGMREGCMLRVEGARMELRGTTKARLFRRDLAAEEYTPPCDLSFLLRT